MIEQSPLGHKTAYIQTYTPDLLFPVPRSLAREKTGITAPFPFQGADIWNGFELSWLGPKGKPEIALATFVFPMTTPNIVESKSFKLYLNSYNQSTFSSLSEVEQLLAKDLSKAAGGQVQVTLFSPYTHSPLIPGHPAGECLDTLDIETNVYTTNPSFLQISKEEVKESLYSHLLKSNCLATGQPDWGSVQIEYEGPQINHEGLLRYWISFRNHAGFAEHCAEQMFWDIWNCCHPKKLCLSIRYTRRGGLDINPYRSSHDVKVQNQPTWRQ